MLEWLELSPPSDHKMLSLSLHNMTSLLINSDRNSPTPPSLGCSNAWGLKGPKSKEWFEIWKLVVNSEVWKFIFYNVIAIQAVCYVLMKKTHRCRTSRSELQLQTRSTGIKTYVTSVTPLHLRSQKRVVWSEWWIILDLWVGVTLHWGDWTPQ